RMVGIAVAFGMFAGLAGAFISYSAPSMPTGPWMVVVSSAIAFFSFFFAPRKGIVPKLYTQYRNQRIIAEENTLKMFYHLGERNSHFNGMRQLNELASTREVDGALLEAALKRLVSKRLLVSQGN